MHKNTLFVLTAAVLLGLYGVHYSTKSQQASLTQSDVPQLVAQGNSGNAPGQGQGGGQGNGQGGGQDGGQGGGQGGGIGGGEGGGQGQGAEHGQGGGIGTGIGGGVGGGQGHKANQGGGPAGSRAGGAAGGGGSTRVGIQGRGLRQHAAALDHVMQFHNVHVNVVARSYEFRHPTVHPAALETQQDKEAWREKLHDVACSMYKYLLRLREARPDLRVDYTDWIITEVARVLGENPTEIKAALLGFPHHHEHGHSLLTTLTETGCAVGGQTVDPNEKDFANEHEEHVQGHEDIASPFAIDDQSSGTDIAFRVTGSDGVFTDYGVSHTKEMHLLIVRNDLRHFAHVHPERDVDGTWRLPFTPEAGGTYWLYADFVDADMEHHTVRFEHTYEGDQGQTGFEQNTENRKQFGRYTVILETTPYANGILFTYHINDESSMTPLFEEYLGAMGHGILLSPTGEFIHTHPSPAGDHLTFHLPKNLQGPYRVFAQFKVSDEVLTVDFDWVGEGK